MSDKGDTDGADVAADDDQTNDRPVGFISGSIPFKWLSL